MEWLGLSSGETLLAEADAMQAACCGVTPLLRDVRAQLDAAERETSLARVARALSLSERSLQRRLAEHGTSLKKEIAGARVRKAQRLLAETDVPISQVAYDVGCASPSHFSRLFRSETGETPAQWRVRRRQRIS
jgi:AraC-like DNA-binding protein